MIAPDANLLIYAVDEKSTRHLAAGAWLRDALKGSEPVGLAWNAMLAFFRITTKPGILTKPLSVDEAFDVVGRWLSQPAAKVLQPGPRHFEILHHLLQEAGTAGDLTSDAHLAALAIEHGAEVCSTDADFGRFPGLRWHNPLLRQH